MNKKYSLTLSLIFCALLANAQEAPPASDWESDPLDVLEEQQQQEIVTPTVPEFTEVPEEGADVPAPQVAEPAPFESEATPTDSFTQETVPAQTPAAGFGTAEPDFAREAEFHRIYKKYNEQPTSEETWEKAVGTRQSESYQVQKGDTLWSISSTFFADPNFWPKIWSLNNGSILNPHEIDPKMNIQFFAGSMEDAPTVQLAANGAGEETVEAGGATSAPAGSDTVPAPKKKRVPVLNNIPNSLPLYRLGTLNAPKAELQIELPKTLFPIAPENLGYFLTDNATEGAGFIKGTEGNMRTAGDYQYVFVKLDNASVKDFVVQKNVGQVSDPAVKDRKGQMVEVQGEIEILERVNDQDNVYRAIVKKTVQPIEVGSMVVPGRLPMIDPTPSEVTTGVGAKIIGGQFDKKRSLFGSNSLVFLDSGSSQGLQVGQSLNIFADNRVRNKKTPALVNDRVIGTVKIVNTSGNFATGYITKVTDDVVVGDYVGRSMTSARVSTPGSSSSDTNFDFDDEFESAPSDAPAAAPDSGTSSDDFDLEL